MQCDIFDVLDVSLREDTYSSLIVNVLRRAPVVRSRVFEKLTGLRPAETLEPRFREGIGGGASRKHPDILIEGQTPRGRWWLVIEAKVQSREGWEQTKVYSDLCREAKKGRKCVGYSLFFLTLTGEATEAESWQPLKHKDLAEMISAFDEEHIVQADPLLGPIWAAYGARLTHYEALTPPSDEDRILEWLTRRNEYFVTRNERARLLGPVLIPHGYQVRVHVYSGMAKESFLVLAWKPHWQTGIWTETGDLPLEECIFAHFELDIPLLGLPAEAKNAKCRLHCEVNPYQTAKQLHKCGASIDGFREFMECFSLVLHEGIRGTRWKGSNYRMQRAWLPCPLEDSTTIGDFRRFLAPELAQVRDKVSLALVVAAKECGLRWWKGMLEGMKADRTRR